MYRYFYEAVIAAARKHIGLMAVGMTREYWYAQEIAKADMEQDELRERFGNHLRIQS